MNCLILLGAFFFLQAEGTRFVVERKIDHYGSATSLALSADGKRLAAAGSSGSVILRDVETGRHLWQSPVSQRAVSVDLNPDGSLLAVGRDHASIDILNASTGNLVATSGPGDGDLRLRFDVVFAPDGKLIATASSQPSNSSPASRFGTRLWDSVTARELRVLANPDHARGVLAITFGPDGRWLATSGWDKTIHIFDVASGKLKREIETLEAIAYGLAVHPDGKVLAAAMDTGNIILYDTDTWRVLRTLALGVKPAYRVKFNPKGDLLLSTANEPVIRLWSTHSWKPAGELHAHSAAVGVLVFNRDGRRLVSAGADQNVIVWRRE